MTLKPFLATTAIALTFAGNTFAQDDADTLGPAIVFDAPANGTVLEGARHTLSGTATDATGTITRVEYRIEGSRRWKRATLTAANEATTTWVFTTTFRKRKARRVYVRAIDDSKNESDIVGRRLRRNRR